MFLFYQDIQLKYIKSFLVFYFNFFYDFFNIFKSNLDHVDIDLILNMKFKDNDIIQKLKFDAIIKIKQNLIQNNNIVLNNHILLI